MLVKDTKPINILEQATTYADTGGLFDDLLDDNMQLDNGNQPDDWDKLLSVCKTAQMNDHLEKTFSNENKNY